MNYTRMHEEQTEDWYLSGIECAMWRDAIDRNFWAKRGGDPAMRLRDMIHAQAQEKLCAQ